MRVILDSNIWVSFLLGFQTELVRKVLTSAEMEVFLCEQLLEEIRVVSARPKIRKYCNEKDVSNMFEIMEAYCCYVEEYFGSVNVMLRDSKDVYLLQLADYVRADYLVSGDKDLTELQNHNATKIISLSAFKRLIGYM